MTDIRQIALDTLKSGAPGLSEQTREVIAGIIARKANLTTTPVAETAGEAVRWLIEEHLKTGSIRWQVVEHEVQANEIANALRANGWVTVTPLYAAPVPAQDDDKLRILADRVTAEVKRGADGSHVQALGALSNIEGLVLAALKSTAAQEGGEAQ